MALSDDLYAFTSPLWRWDGSEAAWFFVTVPRELMPEVPRDRDGRRAR